MSKKVCINSEWQFLLKDLERQDLSSQDFSLVELPHTWNNIDGVSGGNDYHRGKAWYLKKLDIDSKHQGSIFLDFEGVNSICDVYLNDQHLGRHEGGYSGFRYDITELVSEENKLEVLVDNSHDETVYPLFADFTFYGGIYRDVNIIYTNDVHFNKMDLASTGVYISQNDVTDTYAKVNVKALVCANEEKEVSVQAAWYDADGKLVLSDEISKTVSGQDTIEMDMLIENPVLWNGVENPYQYKCLVYLKVDGDILDTEEIMIGLRYFEFDEQKGFFLNGKRLQLNGVSRHQDRAEAGNALTHEHQLEDMAIIKEMGANSIRLAHYQHNQFFYDLCDKEGMVVWAEIPYISKTSDTDATASNAISQMRELIRQSYNHASIVMWGVQNEVGMFGEEKPLEQIAREIHDVVKEEDTTRVTTQAQVMMIQEDDPAHYATDTVAWNKYYGWYVGEAEEFIPFIEKFREINPNKAFGISEYGAEGILNWHSDEPKVKDYTEEYHAIYHEKTLKIFNQYDFIWGTYVWNMFDFGSDMRDEGGVQGMNNKGLVTFDRKTRKDAFYFYQSMWSDKPMLHITSKRFVDRHLDQITVKVYSNQDDVKLTHNGQEISLGKREDTVYYFDVLLAEGQNLIEAFAGDLSDKTVFNKVHEMNMDYVLPKDENTSAFNLVDGENVKNWFTDEVNMSMEMIFNEGCFSIKDKIGDIIDHPEGDEVLRKYIAPMFEHSMFNMAKGFSLDTLAGMQPDSMPQALLVMINNELNQIKKQV
ncbi:glycoside hydrolase family 2 protein [Acidaminobacter sp. JC074]|uniref:glycoside hydrolase family 2 protein n=1 Tax=Acidaminobacter sp. JC074 TaxID=2530199 RepID=UPI001F0D5664|nr:glycoside hydrolase family 2 TIM barrel-domain containing protein [Acidaminobacter sp. JC074]